MSVDLTGLIDVEKSARSAAESGFMGSWKGDRAIFWGQYMRLCLEPFYSQTHSRSVTVGTAACDRQPRP